MYICPYVYVCYQQKMCTSYVRLFLECIKNIKNLEDTPIYQFTVSSRRYTKNLFGDHAKYGLVHHQF